MKFLEAFAGMVGYNKTILIVTIVNALCLMVFGSALAMPEYATRFKLSCTFCHSKVPELNEFGASFLKDNPTPPEMKFPRKDGGNRTSQGAGEPADNKGNVRPGRVPGDAVDNHDTRDKPTQMVEKPPAATVYRWIAKDGSRVFTDNPLMNTVSREHKKKGAVTKKSVAPRKGHRSVRQPKVKPVSREKRRVDTSRPGVSAVRYRSYEDCMEQILLYRVKPANADVAMGFFLEAEETCQRFSSVQ